MREELNVALSEQAPLLSIFNIKSVSLGYKYDIIYRRNSLSHTDTD